MVMVALLLAALIRLKLRGIAGLLSHARATPRNGIDAVRVRAGFSFPRAVNFDGGGDDDDGDVCVVVDDAAAVFLAGESGGGSGVALLLSGLD